MTATATRPTTPRRARRRRLLRDLVIAVVAAIIGSAATTTTDKISAAAFLSPKPFAMITSVEDGELVDRCQSIRGSAANLPHESVLWLTYKDLTTGNFYFARITMGADQRWQAKPIFGPIDEIERRYEVFLILVDRQWGIFLDGAENHYSGFGSKALPKTLNSDEIQARHLTVTRRSGTPNCR